MTKLTSEAVTALAARVLYAESEIQDDKKPDDAVSVEGIVATFGFHPERLAAAKPEIDALLKELPDPFHKDKGGGWSFLNACTSRDGRLWTGEQRTMELLVCLGIAVGSASWLGKNMAAIMPGGVPYFEVHPA